MVANTTRILLLTLLAAPIGLAQPDTSCSHDALNLTVGEYGASFGNSARHNGLRFNWSDNCLEEINGFNLTIWKPGNAMTGDVNGLAIGLIGPGAGTIKGVAIGLGGVVTKQGLAGVAIGGIGVVGAGDGIGVTVGGLGAVSDGEFVGISIGGLGLVGSGGLTGINIGGLGAVSRGDVTGISLSIITTQVQCMEGVVTGIYNRVYGRQAGLSVGVFNHATELRGVQIGLINYVEDNPPGLRILPVVNAHF